MTSLRPSLAAAAAATLALSCGSSRRLTPVPAADHLTILSYSPDQAIDAAEPIEIQFYDPVVDDAMVGKPVDPGLVALTPAVAWTGHWRDRQTLVVEPSAALAGGTRYQVALRGELARRTDDFTFDFVHQPLAVDGLWGGIAIDSLAPDGDLPLAFNLPVRGRDAAAKCTLTGADGTKIALTAKAPDKIDVTAPLVLGARLAPGALYTLTCADLLPAHGNAALAEPYSLDVRARPTLEVLEYYTNTAVNDQTTDVPADETTLQIRLSTPVALDAMRRAVTSTPAIPGLDQGWLDGSGATYLVTVDLAEHTKYTLKVGDLADVHGQRLPAPSEFAFATGKARPRLTMEAGIFALEASAKGYPIWTRNLAGYSIECAAIPKAKVVELLTTDMNYDPWGGNDASQAIEWKKYGLVAKTKKLTVANAKNRWNLDDIDLGKTCGRTAGARGVYLADVDAPDIVPDPNRPWFQPRRRRVLANVTDLGVLIKVGPANGIVWVTSLASAAPIAGATVTVYTPAGAKVATAVTDNQGLVRIPGSAIAKAQVSVDNSDDAGEIGGDEEYYEDWDSYRSQRLIAVVEKAGDLAVVDGNWANGIQIWNFGVPEDRRGGVTQVRGFIQSDRGLYRPGDTVHFKGLVREIAQGGGPRLPKGKQLAVEVTDSRGASVYTGPATLSAFGGFHFDLALAEEATVGDYYVKATLGDQVFRERFLVEEYRPAAFELAVVAPDIQRPGARLTFTANARYLFGAPVTDAEVEWNLRRRAHPVRFKGFDEYSFGENGWGWWYGDDGDYGDRYADYGDYIADGTATTDANGNVVIAARDGGTADTTGPLDYIVSVNVTDDSDQTIGKSEVVTVHRQDVYLGVHAQEYVQAVGMPFGVNVVALDPDGKRTAATAKLSFIRDEHRCRWIEVGRRGQYHCDRQQAVAFEREVQIPATGTLTERIFPKDPGSFMVKVETTDGRGVKVIAASQIYVIGKGEAFWSGDESARMTLVASRPSYLPGDTAKLVAQANLKSPTALITIERDGVLQAYTKQLGSASEGIELLVEDGWAPNVFAGVTLVAGRSGPGDRGRPQMKMGLTELKVSTTHKQLAVAIELDRAEVRPGDPVKGTIRVTSGGAPVKAELAVSVADEGVLQLVAYKTPNPLATFYTTWGLGVDSGTNWNRIAKIASPDATDPDEGGDFASSSGGKVRSRFVASAFWQPALVTDARGVAEFSFVAPDNLTAFRVMAVAADVKDRFGAGEQRLTVNKRLMARPALPRFLGAGDATAIGLVIHNQTDKPGTATIHATAAGVILDRGDQTIDVPANGVAKATFAARASESPEATFEFAVAMNGDRDAVKVTVPVRRPRVIESRSVAKGELRAGGKTTMQLAVPASVLRGESELVVSVARNGLGDIEPSLRYLVEYPYGCLEQTMSKFLPLAKGKDLTRTLGLKGLDGTKMDAFLRAGAAKVARHQQGDGHFSLWPQSQTYPQLTVLAIWGLEEAKKAGVTVSDEAIERGIAALAQWASQTQVGPTGDGATLAMAAYLLARNGKTDHALLSRLYEQRAGLPRFGQAFLLRAMNVAKRDPAELATMTALVTTGLTSKHGGLIAIDTWTGDAELYMSSDTRSTAMILSALLEVAPNDPAIPKLVAGLDGVRDPGGHWQSTQDNLWSLVALADYARTTTPGDTQFVVTAGGRPLARGTASGAAPTVVRASLDTLAGDTLELSAAGGNAYYSVRVTEATKDDGAAKDQGFTVVRSYLDDAGRPLATVKAGDLVTVKLEITAAQHRRWIALVDPLPAGLEVVNPRLAASVDTGRPGMPATSVGGGYGYDWEVSWVHQEVRDDEVRWFADDMHDGRYTLVYKARAATAGTFTALPARIEAMYEPEVMGRTAMSSLTIAP